MADNNFKDLLIAVEQLASEVDKTGYITNKERTARQVLEESQELWARVTTTGAQEIKANLLLGTKGVDLPNLSHKLETLNATSVCEPLVEFEDDLDTDIRSFYKNEMDNLVQSLFDSSHVETLEKNHLKRMVKAKYGWEKDREKIMNQFVGRDGEEFLEIPVVPESSCVAEEEEADVMMNNQGDRCLSEDEMRYTNAVKEHNQSVLAENGHSLIDAFCRVAHGFSDQNLTEMWNVVKYMTEIPVIAEDAIKARCVTSVKHNMILQARKYLENRFHFYMRSIVSEKTGTSMQSDALSLVRTFVLIHVQQSQTYILNANALDVDSANLWPVLYYCMRCGQMQAAFSCAQLVKPECEEIFLALEELRVSGKRRVSLPLMKLIRTHYRRRGCDTDPYKRAIFCILGGFDIKVEHPEIAVTADDYLWLKLNYVPEEGESDKGDGFEYLSYSCLQKLIIEEYGEKHYASNKLLYFQLLFLTGQWEAAIDFLLRNNKLRMHGVHVAILLHEIKLLRLTVNVESPLFVQDLSDPKPMYRLNFSRIIELYVSSFENNNLLEALHYYFCLRSFTANKRDNMFVKKVCDLVMKSRKIEVILGHLESTGGRSDGLIDQFNTDKEAIKCLINRVALMSEKECRFEDAVNLFDLIGRHEKVVRLMSLMLRKGINDLHSNMEPSSTLITLAEVIKHRYSHSQLNCDDTIKTTFFVLVDLLKFFDFYTKKHYAEAMEMIENTDLIPLEVDEVEEKINIALTMSTQVVYYLPKVLAAVMNILYSEYTNIKGMSMSETHCVENSKQQLLMLKNRAKVLVTFISGYPHTIPNDVSKNIVEMEMLMI